MKLQAYIDLSPKNLKLAMSSPVKPSSQASTLNLFLFSIPQYLLLQMGTASMLMLLCSEKATTEALKAIGQASEEIFRGDRLPILNWEDVQLAESKITKT